MPVPTTAHINLDYLQTELRNKATEDIDVVSTEDMCRLINEADQTVALCVAKCTPIIASIIDQIAPRIRKGGRVIYAGAGTSGRLGILDASELPPTFSAPYGQWVPLIAGGSSAIQYAVEGAEDSPSSGTEDLDAISPPLDPALDSIIGLAASGRTPYVLGIMEEARSRGCFVAGVCCVKPSAMRKAAELVVECPVGAEVVTGSTRMKSGTAQKMILNMISTGVMIKIGKTYGNLMVDVKRSNHKLIIRARRIFRTVLEPYALPPHSVRLGVDLSNDAGIDQLIDDCEGSVKQGMVAARWGCSPFEARARLDNVGGLLRLALEEHQ